MVRWLSNIHLWILRILHAKSAPGALISAFPSTLFLGEVRALLSYGNSNLIIVKGLTIEIEKLDQMPPEVDLVSSSLLVLPLEIAGDEHCQQKAAHSAVVGLIELPALEETLQYENHWPELRVFFLEELYKLHAIDTVSTVKGDV